MSAPQPTALIIFGALGDLSWRKLMPALGSLAAADQLSEVTVLGVSRRQVDDASFREQVRTALAKSEIAGERLEALVDRSAYQSIGAGSPEDFRALRERLEALEQEHALPGNRIFYLALPPQAFGPTIAGLGECGLNRSAGWTRVVIEKPFGNDLDSARALNELAHEHFDERQIYRIDHYLGKETVQNLLVFRFGNPMFEALWNREHVASVEITVAEELGLGSRAGYYDRTGALRDMLQNHTSQLLTLVGMEVPTAYEADSIRYEKLKVLKAIRPIQAQDVVLGQYTSGEISGEAARGYLEEEGVPSDSTTETFVALELSINNWRWQGVPFYLRTGKRMPRKSTQIAIQFRRPPVCLFESMGSCALTRDTLLMKLQPEEGFSLFVDVKQPGSPLKLRQVPLDFNYSDVEGLDKLPDAYRTLILDVFEGDQTLFVHADEVEASWEIYAPLLKTPPPVQPYRAGSWGPPSADRLASPERTTMQDPR